MRNGDIILAKNIKLDKNYTNVLTYGTDEMIDLMIADGHFVNRAYDYSFIRGTGRISTKFTFSECRSANYMAFKNPDYDNMYFFAFIDNIYYKSDNCTEIEYTVDVWSTWYDYWSVATCYVEREHPVNDTFGANNIPEPISVNDYIVQDSNTLSVAPNKLAMLFSEVRKSDSTIENPDYVSPAQAYTDAGTGIPVVGNMPMTLWRVTADLKQSAMQEALLYFNDYVREGKGAALVGVYLYNNSTDIVTGLRKDRLYNIDGYTPKYSKTLQYPFTKITLSNQAGSSVELKTEDFDGQIRFDYACTNNYKGQAVCYPVQYKGIEQNTDFGLIIDNYPTIPLTVDSYATYLAQNSTNIALSAVGGAVGTVASIASGNPLSAIAGAGNMINTLGQISAAKTKPDSIVGMASGNLINMLLDKFYFLIEFNTCKRDIAEYADSFFDKYGYATNRVKVPNIDGNTHNYVKISNDSCVGYGSVPGAEMDTINSLFRRGVTLWHSHSQLGNY